MADGGQGYEKDPVEKLFAQIRCHLHAQTSLAGATRAGQGQEAYFLAAQQLPDGGYVLLSTNKWSRYDGQVVRGVATGTGCLERWKIGGQIWDDQLEDRARISYVSQTVLSEVAQAHSVGQVVLDEIASRL